MLGCEERDGITVLGCEITGLGFEGRVKISGLRRRDGITVNGQSRSLCWAVIEGSRSLDWELGMRSSLC